jgi:hypothetical protein
MKKSKHVCAPTLTVGKNSKLSLENGLEIQSSDWQDLGPERKSVLMKVKFENMIKFKLRYGKCFFCGFFKFHVFIGEQMIIRAYDHCIIGKTTKQPDCKAYTDKPEGMI